jgi:hypothetical protein
MPVGGLGELNFWEKGFSSGFHGSIRKGENTFCGSFHVIPPQHRWIMAIKA